MIPITVKKLVSADLVKFILTEIRLIRDCLHYVDPKFNTLDDVLTTHYSLLSSETLCKMFTARIENNLGLKLLPTFSLVEYANKSATIPSRVGRSSSEISVICCLEGHWPLTIDQQEIILEPGDVCIYTGSESSYKRNPLIGDSSVSIILNYVNAAGDLNHLALDTRPVLGAAISTAAPVVMAEQASLGISIR